MRNVTPLGGNHLRDVVPDDTDEVVDIATNNLLDDIDKFDVNKVIAAV